MNVVAMGRSLVGKKFNSLRSPVRHAGGYLKKNIWVEENAGIRENGYKTWHFTALNTLELLGFVALPTVLIYFTIVEEDAIRTENTGRIMKKEKK